ncbi:methyltransferase family protein [Elongatibacter sediminis]|uniref:Isoprenylcysteine carboxylmethyltransferase family protein n=1 Tax=Elongatibacter sediminis TaxID=3119006 RepID=A0AAW9RH15_9GAMM
MNAPAPFRKPRILPPMWLALTALAMVALDRWLPLAQPVGEHGPLLFIIFLIPALVILAWSVAAFLRVRTGLVPFSESTALVTTGLYRFSRNPMYLAMVLLLIAGAFRLGSVGAWLPIPVFAWIIHHRFILNEERFLESVHGEDFRVYCGRVRRWL